MSVSSLARLTCQACYFSHSSFCNYTIAWAARKSAGSRQCPLQSTSSRISIKHGCINLLLQTKLYRGMTRFLKALNSFCVPSRKHSELLDQVHAAGTHNRVCLFPAIPWYQFLSPGQLGLGSGRPWCWKSSAFRYWAAKKTLSLNNLIGQLPEKLNQILFGFKLKEWLQAALKFCFLLHSHFKNLPKWPNGSIHWSKIQAHIMDFFSTRKTSEWSQRFLCLMSRASPSLPRFFRAATYHHRTVSSTALGEERHQAAATF